MPIFCWHVYFVDTNIWLMHIFWQCQYFVDKDYLLTHIFCRRQYFVDAFILLTPIFCWHQYFVDAYILLTLIFCRCRGFGQRLYSIYCKLLCCVYIMIINLYKPSQVSTARYLSITVSITIKVGFILPHSCKTWDVCRKVVGLTAQSQLLVHAGGNIQQYRGSSWVAPFFLSQAGQCWMRGGLPQKREGGILRSEHQGWYRWSIAYPFNIPVRVVFG